MVQRKFTISENRILTEIYRRLNYFKKGDLHADLLLLELPSEAKRIKDKNIVIFSNARENKRALNWYKLTPKGKKLFSNYLNKITEAENLQIFKGRKVINFNKPLSQQI